MSRLKDCIHVSKKEWLVVMNDIQKSKNTKSVLLVDEFNAKPLYVTSNDFRYDYPYNELPNSPPLFFKQKHYLKWLPKQIRPNTFYLQIHVCNIVEVMNKVVSKFKHIIQFNCHFFIVNKQCIEFLIANCPKLQVLNFENSIGIHLNSCQLFTKLVNLRHLNLNGCDIYENSLEAILKSCPNLKSLNIGNNCEITGRCLLWINRSIERLDLRECWRIESHELIAMSRLRLESLIELLINSGLNDETMENICDNCLNIRHLNISFDYLVYNDKCGRTVLSDTGFSQISKLKNLEILTLRHVGRLTDYSLQSILKGCNNLHQLTLNLRHRHHLTDNALKDIAVLCPKLRYLETVHNHFIAKQSLFNICQIHSIAILILRGNELVDNQITHVINECQNLRFLNLDGCDVNEVVLMTCIERAVKLQPNNQIFTASLIRTKIDRQLLTQMVLPMNFRVRLSGDNNYNNYSEFDGKQISVRSLDLISPYFWCGFN